MRTSMHFVDHFCTRNLILWETDFSIAGADASGHSTGKRNISWKILEISPKQLPLFTSTGAKFWWRFRPSILYW